ncbi:MAG: RodZ domain-containing protein [Prochlorococcaceae cyanobacterium]
MPNPPEPEFSPGPPAEELSVDELEQELTRVKAELEEYQGLIEELPTIYEGKFRHQLHDVAQDIRRLLDEQQALQEQISHALTAAQQPEALSTVHAAANPSSEPPAPTAPSASRGTGPLSALRSRFGPASTESASPSRGRLVLTAAVTTLTVAALVTGLGLWRRSRVPQLAVPAVPPAAPQASSPAPTTALKPASQPEDEPQLRLRFNGECWIEVQTLAGETVLVNTFQAGDVRRLPLGEGLRLLVGRPDLLEVAVGEVDFRTLGPIDRIDWVVIRPPGNPEGSS